MTHWDEARVGCAPRAPYGPAPGYAGGALTEIGGWCFCSSASTLPPSGSEIGVTRRGARKITGGNPCTWAIQIYKEYKIYPGFTPLTLAVTLLKAKATSFA